MISLRRLSLPRRIVAIAMIISTAALLLASAALIGYDYVTARSDLRSGTTTSARIIADDEVAAVSFNDRPTAMETLNALRAQSSILAACVYSGTALFAQYLKDSAEAPCSPEPPREMEQSRSMLVFAPIELKGKQIGTVELRATLEPAYAHLRLEVMTIAAILLVSAIFALLLSARLQRLVSEPILSLTRTANEVSARKDYSIRAVKRTEDELGTLVDAFNAMLAQIQTMLREIHAREMDLQDRTAALETANLELQKANKMKDEFLATLSHELRTPLTAIFGWINLLQTGNLDKEKTSKAVDVIDRNVRAQIQLVDDLLNVSQIIAGKMKIHPVWTQAGTIIRTAVDSIQPAASAKGIHVVTEIANPAEPVFADAERIQQVLWNLLTNAIKFSDKGGEVKVECGRVGARLQISVTDTGEGIDPEFIPFLFERFTQADASRTRKHGGLGLGLAIVRHIVESHGGIVMVHSKGKGYGASFIVQLPVPAVKAESAAASQTRTASLKGLKIMLVEDEFDTREMVAESLEQSGATVLLAASGLEALRVLARQTPDVLVSDIGMPEMDGYELMRKIRSELPSTVRTIGAVALTAFATEQDKEKSLQAGYQAYLVKPVTLAELITTVASVAKRGERE
jgi:signal transduction histidine kinase/ActR/RegA family two-component response regulator